MNLFSGWLKVFLIFHDSCIHTCVHLPRRYRYCSSSNAIKKRIAIQYNYLFIIEEQQEEIPLNPYYIIQFFPSPSPFPFHSPLSHLPFPPNIPPPPFFFPSFPLHLLFLEHTKIQTTTTRQTSRQRRQTPFSRPPSTSPPVSPIITTSIPPSSSVTSIISKIPLRLLLLLLVIHPLSLLRIILALGRIRAALVLALGWVGGLVLVLVLILRWVGLLAGLGTVVTLLRSLLLGVGVGGGVLVGGGRVGRGVLGRGVVSWDGDGDGGRGEVRIYLTLL